MHNWCINNQSIDGLKIVLIDTNQIIATNYCVSCSIYKNTEISGNGSLSLSSTGNRGIYIHHNTTLTIKDCNITASGWFGITGYNGSSDENLVIDNATVNATGSGGSIVDLASLTLNGCFITAPQGAEFDSTLHAVALNGTAVTQQVVIETSYSSGLYIAGVEVTSANAGDLTVIEGVSVASGGAVTYNQHNHTLTLNKATISSSSSYGCINNQSIDGLKIVLIDANQITATKNHVSCSIYKNTEISGNGSLSLSSTGNRGIYIHHNTTLTIKDCNITASGYWGITGGAGTSDENLVIDNATVKATGSHGSIAGLASLTINGCEITAPAGAAFNNTLHAVALDGTAVTQQVVIEPPYGLEIAGVPVASANAGDLTVIPGVSVASGGAVTYNHTNKTLTLNKATIIPSLGTEEGICNRGIDGLTIVLIDANQITTTSFYRVPCSVYKNTEISGNGSLSLSAIDKCGIFIASNTTLTIKDCNITASGYGGYCGITGYNGTSDENLVIDNATVKATGSHGSIVGLASLTLNGCFITAPQGAEFDSTLHAVALDGTAVTQQVVIEPSINRFTGTGEWATASNWSGNEVPSATDNAIIEGNATVASDVTINDLKIEGSLTVAAEGKLTVNGELSNDNADNLIIKAGKPASGQSLSSSGSLMHTTGGVLAKVEVYTDNSNTTQNSQGFSRNWHFISSPVSGQSIASFVPDSLYDFYCYNEPTAYWINYKNNSFNAIHGSSSFAKARGYLVAFENEGAKLFADTLNTGDISISLSKTEPINTIANHPLSGFNLVGNPYPSYIDWDAASGWSRSALGENPSFWVYNADCQNYAVYAYGSGGTGTNGANNLIAPCQGFFVKATKAGSLSMNDKVRTNEKNGYFKETVSNVKVKVCSENGNDEVAVLYGYDNEGGAEKMFSVVPTAPSLYLPCHGIDYSILMLGETREESVIPMSFKAGAEGDYTLSLSANLTDYSFIGLKDLACNKLVNLKEQSYSFTATPQDAENRFALLFKSSTDFDENVENELFAYVSDGNIVVNGTGTVQVIDMLGRVVHSQDLHDETSRLSTYNLISGTYLLRLISNEDVKVQKIIIQ